MHGCLGDSKHLLFSCVFLLLLSVAANAHVTFRDPQLGNLAMPSRVIAFADSPVCCSLQRHSPWPRLPVVPPPAPLHLLLLHPALCRTAWEASHRPLLLPSPRQSPLGDHLRMLLPRRLPAVLAARCCLPESFSSVCLAYLMPVFNMVNGHASSRAKRIFMP